MWGKHYEEDNISTNDSKLAPRYYYSSSVGQVLSSNGSGYVLNDIGSHATEKKEYIPKDSAFDKLRGMLVDNESARRAYEENIKKLEIFYQSAMQESKTFYETELKVLTSSAKRHVEIQRKIRSQGEERLTRELKQSEEALDELRDSMANLNRQYQDQVRDLQMKISDLEMKNNGLCKTLEMNEQKNSVSQILSKLIDETISRELTERASLMVTSINENRTKAMTELEQKFSNEIHSREISTDTIISESKTRKECETVLNTLLGVLEINSLNSQLKIIQNLHVDIEELQQKYDVLECLYEENKSTLSDLTLKYVDLENSEKNIKSNLSQLQEEKVDIVDRHQLEKEDAIVQLKAKFNSVLKRMKDIHDRAEVELSVAFLVSTTVEKELMHVNSTSHQSHDSLNSKNENKRLIENGSSHFDGAGFNSSLENKRRSTRRETAMLRVQAVRENKPAPIVDDEPDEDDDAMFELLFELETLKYKLEEAQHELANIKANNATSPLASSNETNNSVKDQLKEQISGKRNLHMQLFDKIKALQANLDGLREERDTVKQDIKQWTKEFTDQFGREPEVADKAQIRDKYQRYKTSSTEVKEIEAQLSDLESQYEALNIELQELSAQLDPITEETASKDTALEAQMPVSILTQDATDEPPKLSSSQTPHMLQTELSGDALPVVNSSNVSPETQVKVITKIERVVEPYIRPPSSDVEVQVNGRELRQLQADEISASSKIPKISATNLPEDQISALNAELDKMHQEHESSIDKYEDKIYFLQEELETARLERTKVENDRLLLKEQLDALVKEKRTDVVKRFEVEIERLQTVERTLSEKLTSLSTEKQKLELRVTELKERAERSELELKERDLLEQKKLNSTEEAAQLKLQINKQRDQIVLKSKAATAGWDAAANADEKLELAVQRAFAQGAREEREKHAGDLQDVNRALEVKETRITELLVQMADMERRVRHSDEEKAELVARVDAMKLEVADTIASIQQMSLSRGAEITSAENDGEPTLGPTYAELDSAREQLDAAQEELISTIERCDRLEAELDVSRRKNRIFEQLAQVSGLTSGKVHGSGSSGGVTKKENRNLDAYNINEVISDVKKAILKGTNLWKSNRKDDCYDVYLEACESAMNHLLTDELLKNFRDQIDHGRQQGQQSKQRGAVVFRKILDKFLTDVAQPSVKSAEENAVLSLRSAQANSKADEQIALSSQAEELLADLAEIENNLLDQGYTKENNPTNSSSPREGRENEADRGASLLQRAKSAEAQALSLKKQLAAVIAATATKPVADASAATTVNKVSGKGSEGAQSTSVGANPTELRRLNKRIKDLENELKQAQQSGGGGGGGANSSEFKALQASEKALQKKLKDIETNQKREAKGLEMRAQKAENALSKIQGTHGAIVEERDKLRSENAKLVSITNELGPLRERAERCDAVESELQAKAEEATILAEQLKKESALRKKYKNELEDLKGAIRVYARCRPMARYELDKGCKQCVQLKDDTSLKVITTRGEKEFEFDTVFGANSTQEQVFEDTKRLVESCLDGFNVCVFAYGQTGSGKTFTMTGSDKLPGLTPKAVDEIYRLISDRPHMECKVTTYFVELYNDNLVDLYWLLDNKASEEPPKLEIKMDAKKMVFIRNSVIKEAPTPADLMELFRRGNEKRHTGATKMNAESSRSHSIFAIMVESFDTTTKKTITGKLSLVDLAGSERADKTGASADRLKEAQSINKSLSALGDVIAALSEGGANKFIPYRNNKLTQLMQDSLGGNAKTLMFVNFSPADYNADETTTSLMYAARVKKIVNNASKQAESEEVARLKQIIKRLQAGQPVADLEAPTHEEENAPVVEDDGKVYDGY